MKYDMKYNEIMTYAFIIVLIVVLSIFLFGCGPTIKGVVVYPDGTPIKDKSMMEITVITNPWTEVIKVEPNGKFVIKNVLLDSIYDFTAQAMMGVPGMVKNYRVGKNNPLLVIKLSKELTARESVKEGELYLAPETSAENIFRKSE